MEKMIWHNKIEFPDTEEGVFVYVFDDGVDVEEFEEDFFFASNLIKWAYWEDVLKAIDFFENPNEIKRLKYDVGNLGYKIKNQKSEINNRLKEIDKLKDLLKECKELIDRYIVGEYTIELCDRIDEVLK